MVSYRRGYVIEIEDATRRGQKILELLEKHGRLLLVKEGPGIRIDVPRGMPAPQTQPMTTTHVIAARLMGAKT